MKRKETGPVYFQAHGQSDQNFNEKSLEEINNFTVWIVKEVSKMAKGKSFGELALITSKPRAATIKCLEETDLAVFDKLSYEKVVGKA